MVRPTNRRNVVRWLIDHRHVSQRKACGWVDLSCNAVAKTVGITEKDQASRVRRQMN